MQLEHQQRPPVSFGLVGLERRRSCCSRLVVDAWRRAGPSRCHSSLSSSKWFRGKSPVRRRLQSCSCRASVRGCTLFLWWRTYSCMRACWSCVCTCIYLAMHARIRVRARARSGAESQVSSPAPRSSSGWSARRRPATAAAAGRCRT